MRCALQPRRQSLLNVMLQSFTAGLSYSSTYKYVNKTQRVHQNASQMSFLPLDGIFMKTDHLIKQSPGVSVMMSLSTVLDEWVTPVICWTSLLVNCDRFWLAVVHQLTQIYLSPLWLLFLVHVWTPPPPLKYESFFKWLIYRDLHCCSIKCRQALRVLYVM